MFSVIGKGIICKDPELRHTTNGTPVCNAVAVNNDEYNGVTTGHFTQLVLWGDRAEDFAKEITKGCLIEIKEAILKHPVIDTRNGKFHKTEVTVLDWELIQKFEPKPNNQNNARNSRNSRSSRNSNQRNSNK